VALTMFHHADISLGRADRWLRWLVVTPDIHKVHHSRWRPETDSNYSTVLSVWDRLAGSLRLRPDPATLTFGLDEFAAAEWQTVGGMLATPFTSPVEQANSGESRGRLEVGEIYQAANGRRVM
jgi:sterol desaturase/sphingolipid hydroxylase (fatty acid hydroxylase superfamily)